MGEVAKTLRRVIRAVGTHCDGNRIDVDLRRRGFEDRFAGSYEGRVFGGGVGDGQAAGGRVREEKRAEYERMGVVCCGGFPEGNPGGCLGL